MYPKPTHQKSTHQKSTHFGWGIEDNRNTGSYLFEFHWDFSSVIQFSFILVEPGEAGNIGAAARAMNTMGYTDLRLVRPQADHLSGIAKAFAHGSEHILEAAPVYEDLKDAIADIDLACATTARHRLQKVPLCVSPRFARCSAAKRRFITARCDCVWQRTLRP